MVNSTFKDIYKTVSKKADETSSQFKPYNHDAMVKMNDYTKNISQSIFNPGELQFLKQHVKRRISHHLNGNPFTIKTYDHHRSRGQNYQLKAFTEASLNSKFALQKQGQRSRPVSSYVHRNEDLQTKKLMRSQSNKGISGVESNISRARQLKVEVERQAMIRKQMQNQVSQLHQDLLSVKSQLQLN